MFNRNAIVTLGAALMVSVLAGCGSAGYAPTGADMVLTQRQSIAKSASVKSPVAAAKTNRQESVITIAAPAEVAGTGAIAMNFKFPAKAGYSVLATAADINKLTVVLKTKGFLLSKTVATAEVLRSQIVNNAAAINFTGLAAGTYTLEINALDSANANIGTATESVPVTAGQTATVNSKLQLKGGTTATPGTTGMNVNLQIVNG